MPSCIVHSWAGIVFLVVSTSSAAWADIKDEGRNLRVTGKLTAIMGTTITVDIGDGKTMNLAITPRTRGEILSSAAKDVLSVGVPAVVNGDRAQDGSITNANIIVFMDDVPGSVSVFPGGSNKFAFAGVVLSADPLVFLANDLVGVQYVINPNNGQRTAVQNAAGQRISVSSIAKNRSSYGGLHINIGTRLNLLRPGAYVSASVSKDAGQAVNYVHIRQDEELTAKDLGIAPKEPAKKKREKKVKN